MANDSAFFLAPDDRSAAGVHLRGPEGRFPAVAGHFFYADDAVETWDAFLAVPPPDRSFRQRARWIVPVTNDGSGMFAVPPLLTRRLAAATPEELASLAAHWTDRLRAEDGDDMTDDDLPALVRGVAHLATTAVTTGAALYCWFF